MVYPDDVKMVIEEYIEKSRDVLKHAKPTDGIMGFGSSPKNNQCHMDFYEKLQAALTDCGDPYGCIKLIFEADSSFECPDMSRPMLTAIQGLAIPLIGRLSSSEKDELRNWYDVNVPKRLRLPIQKDVYKELKK